MTIEFDHSGCLDDRASGGLSQTCLDAVVAATEPIVARLRSSPFDEEAALFDLPPRRDDLDSVADLAAAWRERFERLVLFGIGGSSLGAQTLAVLRRPDAPRLEVPDNIDPQTMDTVLAPEGLEKAGFLLVSKSGGTAETMVQSLAAVQALERYLGVDAVKRHCLAVTENTDNPMRRLAKHYDIPVLEHDPQVGGRFSVLSLVGLLPAMMLGLNVGAIREGAAGVLERCLGSSAAAASDPAIGAALSVALQRERGVSQSVLLCYIDSLFGFTRWYRQLWAESLGKEGHGTTPVDAMGPVDQHSQLQLYLGGPADKVFTVVTGEPAGAGPIVDSGLASAIGADYLGGHSIGDLVAAEQRATIETLIANGRPVRQIRIPRLDEQAFGALFMHFILETIITAGLIGIDPFGQPAVEQGKVLARQYLEGGG